MGSDIIKHAMDTSNKDSFGILVPLDVWLVIHYEVLTMSQDHYEKQICH